MKSYETIEPRPFCEGIGYGEGPRWHNGRLWLSDGPAGRVYSVGEAGDLAIEAAISHASGLGRLPDGTLVVPTLFAAQIHHVDTQGALLPPMTSATSPSRPTTCSSRRTAWCFDTGEFVRVVDGGAITHRVPIEQGWAVAPTLGGADGRTLYMVVDDTDMAGLVKGESTGWILQARVDVPGAGSP